MHWPLSNYLPLAVSHAVQVVALPAQVTQGGVQGRQTLSVVRSQYPDIQGQVLGFCRALLAKGSQVRQLKAFVLQVRHLTSQSSQLSSPLSKNPWTHLH